MVSRKDPRCLVLRWSMPGLDNRSTTKKLNGYLVRIVQSTIRRKYSNGHTILKHQALTDDIRNHPLDSSAWRCSESHQHIVADEFRGHDCELF